MQDNGQRRTFDTGSVRDTITNKPAMELVSPFSLERLGQWFRKGAEKYAQPVLWDPTLPGLTRMLKLCSCNHPCVIPIDGDMPQGSVEAAMKKASELKTQSLQNDRDRTLGTGPIETELVSGLRDAITSPLHDRNYSPASGYSQTESHVISADARPGIEPWPSITITRQDALAAFSVSNATSVSVTSRTLRNFLTGHSSTCEIRLFRMQGMKIWDPNRRNWELGQPYSQVTGSMFRHLLKWMAGDESEDHLAAIAWNAMAIMHYQEMIKRGALPETLNDMPDYRARPEIDERAFDFRSREFQHGVEAAPPAVPSGDSPRRGEALVR